MSIISSVIIEITQMLSQGISGKLLAEEQIKRISRNVVGKYFTDFLPTPKDEAEVTEQVQSAHQHITGATHIISNLQKKLETQVQQLDRMVKDIEEKRQLADHYTTLAQSNRQLFDAFRKEMEDSVKIQLRSELEKGKRVRQIASVIVWLATLIAGAALGAYFIPLVNLIRNWFGT
jgi:hypothetical protein